MSKREAEFTARVLAGECLYRQDSFKSMIRVYSCTCEDVAKLRETIKELMPRGVNVRLLLDHDDDKIFLTSERWEALVWHAGKEGGLTHYLVWFENPPTSWQIVSSHRATLLEMNIALTAIEKAFLTLDPWTSIRTRYATGENRSVIIGRSEDDKWDEGDIANVANVANGIYKAASDAQKLAETADQSIFSLIVENTVVAGAKAVDSFNVAMRNKAHVDSGGDAFPLVLMYSGTPALPDECRYASERALEEAGLPPDTISPMGRPDGNLTLKGITLQATETLDGGLKQFGVTHEDLPRIGKKAMTDISSLISARVKDGAKVVKDASKQFVDTNMPKEFLNVNLPKELANASMPKESVDSDAGQQEESDNQAHCATCGAALIDGAKFCMKCGAKVD